jgi:dTDP-4-dehydrorhamnose reductase
MSKILLLGKNGQLGFELNHLLGSEYPVTALSSSDLDLVNTKAIRECIQSTRPEIVINAAAYTAVDKAESEPDLAHAVNCHAPAVLAEELKKSGGLMIHYSTDYVFDGYASEPYRESDSTNPQGVYGKSKLEGEQAIVAADIPYLIFRTSWVYGPRGNNFLLTMLRLLQEREEVKVVDDQVGAPTTANALASATVKVLEKIYHPQKGLQLGDSSGIYHMTCQGQTSWYGFADEIAKRLAGQGKTVAEVVPIPSSEYPTPAKRPAWSVLDNSKLRMTFGIELPAWQSALENTIQQLGS